MTETAGVEVRQATVHTFDANTGHGSVITDAGLVIGFPAKAWQSGRLLTLRVGQRVRVAVDDVPSGAEVTSLTLVTFSG